MASQFLEKENRLTLLQCMEGKTVPFLIFGEMSIAVAKWANLRDNEIASRYVLKPSHHGLVYEFSGLRKLQ